MMCDRIMGGADSRANDHPPLTTQPLEPVAMADLHLSKKSKPRKDLTGNRYGKLVVVSWAGHSHWNCACDCGGKSVVLTANLTRHNTTSCGCIRNHMSSVRNTKHGLHGTRAYKIWAGIKARCSRPSHPSYKDYGAKGIGMWDRWAADPERFIADVGHPPSPQHSMDRIDNSKGYEPGNVRWATAAEQAVNKTNNVFVAYRGQRMTISQMVRAIADECGLPPRRIARDINKELNARGVPTKKRRAAA